RGTHGECARSAAGVGLGRRLGLFASSPTIRRRWIRHKVPFGYLTGPGDSDVPEWDLAERLVGEIVLGMTRIRVLVPENHPSVRENLRYLINAEPDMEC